jgi:hypothetical protein
LLVVESVDNWVVFVVVMLTDCATVADTSFDAFAEDDPSRPAEALAPAEALCVLLPSVALFDVVNVVEPSPLVTAVDVAVPELLLVVSLPTTGVVGAVLPVPPVLRA